MPGTNVARWPTASGMKIDAARPDGAVVFVVFWVPRDSGTESGSKSFTPAGKRVDGDG
jgi:hypothetical protein